MQYYAPWFRQLATSDFVDLEVFYLWDFGIKNARDPDFGVEFSWDVPLCEGYSHRFVKNLSHDPGTHHFRGLDNPSLSRELRAWNPDAVLTIGYNDLSRMRLLATWPSRRIPLIFRGDSHLLGKKHRSCLRKTLLRLIFSRFSAFLSTGSANEAYLRMCGAKPHEIFTAPHAVDNERFKAAATTGLSEARTLRIELGIKNTERIALFAGKLEPKKCPLELLEAYEACRVDNTVLCMVGSGKLESEAHAMADRMKKRVCFLPFQNQTRMPIIYAAADFLVLPSYGGWETWGLAVNEAMACARPAIVSSHVGCAADLIIPEKTGWIFPAGDKRALTACLEHAFHPDTDLRQMGAHAQNHVITTHSYSNTTQGLRQALRYLNLT